MDEEKKLRSELIKTMVQLATAGFGLVAALAWNEAIKNLIDRFVPTGSGLLSRLIYALIVTLIAVFVTYYLGKAAQRTSVEEEKAKEKEEKKN